ncbi:hypothetical protein KOI35_22515 [Actinoplanes bogorensis]|uniref:2'-5' RNA ligase family protein n=1 Tax=Paractinoplanes bogorensis TaxID=1610840 RepID=A0ABS5YS54_9ACTN|nr:hypothetical protein [Actinoplanes bogorensis]MBU2666280.1 hypothetical protein [Actinoplanes bogorensis]
MHRDRFDQLFDNGRTAVLSGQHQRDIPPYDGSERWGISVIFRPDDDAVARLDAVTRQAMAVAGPGHWPTGNERALHITVRALESHRTGVAPDDPAVARYGRALRRAAREARPARFGITGLTLTPGGVMACLRPDDDAADSFAARIADELGADAAYEAGFHRDIWYSTLVHFAGPLADPPALVDFVAAARSHHLGPVRSDAAEVIHWRYDGRQTVPEVIHRSTMEGAGRVGERAESRHG